ncbi:unnamed protein product [Calypogeia fissa]
MEVVITADIHRRAGADLTLASVEKDLEITASRNVKLVADTLISSCEDQCYDLIVLPGGMPEAERLRDCATLTKLLSRQLEVKKPMGAICAAAAVVLEAKGQEGYKVTSRGPGTAMEFALSIVGKVAGQSRARMIAESLVLPYA